MDEKFNLTQKVLDFYNKDREKKILNGKVWV